MEALEPDLAGILEEARRLAGRGLPWRLHQKGEEKCLVFELGEDDALAARRLVDALYAFCDARGSLRRFLVVRSTGPRWGPTVPDRLPPEAAQW